MVVFLVLLEFPALMIGVAISPVAARRAPGGPLLHEVFSGKSIVLLLGGPLSAGSLAPTVSSRSTGCSSTSSGHAGLVPARDGLVAAGRLADLRRAGPLH